MFNWNDLRYLIEVGRAGNLSGAATRLSVSHSTVGRRIQALESSLSAQLFERTPAGFLPTTTGAELIKLAEQVESTCHAGREIAGGRNTMPVGTVRLGAPEGFGSRFLGTNVEQLYKQYPGIDLEVVAGTQFLSISKREADLAITLSRPRVGRLIARKLCDYTLQLYGSRSYLKRSLPIQRVDDLLEHNLVGYIDDLIYAPQLRYLDEIIPKARVKLRSSSINAQLAAVEAGLGLGCVDICLSKPQDNGG